MTPAPAHDEYFDSLLGDFLDESGQLLDRLNENLLALDEWVRSLDEGQQARCDRELMNEMFRAAHSIKGLSAMLGLSDINGLTHKVENLFDAARNDQLDLNPYAVELLFQVYDCLVGMIGALRDPALDPVEFGVVVEAIQTLLSSAGVTRAATSQADAERALAALSQPANDASGSPPETTSTVLAVSEVQPPKSNATSQATLGATTRSEAAGEQSPPAPGVDYFAEIEDETEVPAKYLAIFIDEAELSLDQLTETLLDQESVSSRAGAEQALIVSHRIKGSAAAVGLHRPAKLAHLMEDLLQKLREENQPLSGDMADALLRATDALRGYLTGLKDGQAQALGFNEAAERLQGWLVGAGPAASVTATAVAVVLPTDAEVLEDGAANEAAHDWISALLLDQLLASQPGGSSACVGRVVFEPNFPLVTLKAQLVCEKLLRAGELFHCDPPACQLDALEELQELVFAVATQDSHTDLAAQLHIAGVRHVDLRPLPGGPLNQAEPDRCTAPATAVSTKTSTLTATTTPVSPTPRATASPGLASTSIASGAPTLRSVAPAPPVQAAVPHRAATAGTAPASVAAPFASEVKAKADADPAVAKPTETLRVDIERLDQLMNLAGQLVINKARFARIAESMRWMAAGTRTTNTLGNVCSRLDRVSEAAEHAGRRGTGRGDWDQLAAEVRRVQCDLELVRREVDAFNQARASVNNLLEAVHQLDRVSDGIQKSVMDTRMVPIGPLFTRFRRVIRDITRASGKDIALEILGEKTELDKRMIDELGDPLIHMVRNSADHGIESPEARRAAGKPAQGKVTLNAFHRGNHIVIQVVDDGKGLDLERIRRKAVDKGVVSEADAERMTPHQVYQLIWEAGFSTAEKVTEISGRGMGMDIVRSKIEGVNGTVELDSRPGQGTTFTIKLPLTLAILPSLMAEVDGDVFALPIESVVEIVRVGADDQGTVHGLRTARVRGRVISVVDLDEVFTWSRPASAPGARHGDDLTLVVLGSEHRELGLAVDHLLGEEDVVIKSLAENYRNVTGIAGASVLGDGRVSLILDVPALIEMAARPAVAL